MYAKAEFELSEKQKDGSTKKETLLNVARQLGKLPKELEDIPDLPDVCVPVWNWFMTLNSCRGSNGFGLSNISHQEMLAFFTLEQITPESWQVELLRRFDNVALEHHYKMQKKEQDKQNQDKPQTPKQKQERQSIGKRPK